MLPGTLEAATINGKLYGLLVSANTKSFVWYPKKAWDAAGYKAPTTIDELNALTDKIKADKTATAPWCLGIESSAATGWPATDWFEDLIMRYGGTDGYNKWVTHQIKFDSPLVRQAAAEFEKIAFTDGNVLGGRKSIASNNFGTAGNAMFDPKPGCMLYKQGSFITTFFPKNVQADLASNVGVFYFPPATAGGEKPILGGGDTAVLLKDIGRRPRGHEDARRQEHRREGHGQQLPVPAQGLQHPAVQGRAQPGDRRDHLRFVDLPLRRLRPDAGRRRSGHVLEGHDRLDQRPGEPGRSPDEHRQQLAIVELRGTESAGVDGPSGPSTPAALAGAHQSARQDPGRLAHCARMTRRGRGTAESPAARRR